MPEQVRGRRHRQILTEETEDSLDSDSHASETAWIPEDPWVRNFIVRLAHMIRKTGGKN
jgi:hypothetical protein